MNQWNQWNQWNQRNQRNQWNQWDQWNRGLKTRETTGGRARGILKPARPAAADSRARTVGSAGPAL